MAAVVAVGIGAGGVAENCRILTPANDRNHDGSSELVMNPPESTPQSPTKMNLPKCSSGLDDDHDSKTNGIHLDHSENAALFVRHKKASIKSMPLARNNSLIQNNCSSEGTITTMLSSSSMDDFSKVHLPKTQTRKVLNLSCCGSHYNAIQKKVERACADV